MHRENHLLSLTVQSIFHVATVIKTIFLFHVSTFIELRVRFAPMNTIESRLADIKKKLKHFLKSLECLS